MESNRFSPFDESISDGSYDFMNRRILNASVVPRGNLLLLVPFELWGRYKMKWGLADHVHIAAGGPWSKQSSEESPK